MCAGCRESCCPAAGAESPDFRNLCFEHTFRRVNCREVVSNGGVGETVGQKLPLAAVLLLPLQPAVTMVLEAGFIFN